MPYSVATEAIRWLLRDDVSEPGGTISVVFFGGEPLLEMPTIKRLVPFAERVSRERGRQISFSATTNGTLFTGEVAKFWKEHRLNYLLSCDGTPRIHDLHRRFPNNEGSMRAVQRNFDSLLGASEKSRVRLTVTPRSAGSLLESVEYLERQGFREICFYHNLEGQWSADNLRALSISVSRVARKMITSIKKQYLVVDDAIDAFIRRVVVALGDQWRTTPLCGAGRGLVAVGVDGTLYPCQRFASMNGFRGAFPIGDVRTGFRPAARIPFLRFTREKLLGCDIDCGLCSLRGVCSGGCLAANFELTGHLGGVPKVSRLIDCVYHEAADKIVRFFDRHPSNYFDKRYRREFSGACADP